MKRGTTAVAAERFYFISIQVLPPVMRKDDLEGVNGLIRAFVADLQAFTHENIMAELTGNKENQLAMFAKIR